MLHTADTPEPDTTGLLRAFIAEQPVATERLSPPPSPCAPPDGRHSDAGLTLVGSGSSSNAITAARPAFAHGGAMVSVLGPEDFLQDFPPTAQGKRAVIILSQSGNSRTSVAAARAALDGGAACLAITMNPRLRDRRHRRAIAGAAHRAGADRAENQGLHRLAGGLAGPGRRRAAATPAGSPR